MAVYLAINPQPENQKRLRQGITAAGAL